MVVQNFRPGVMTRLGYGYEDFRAVNPRIVYCSGSGYGEDGPYVERPGQDMLIQGLTGIMAATGRADQPPTPVGAGFSDQVGAMNMVYGILTALLRYDDPATLYERRDEIWRAIAAETGKWARAELMAAMLDADIWCGEVKTHLEAEEDPQVQHLGLIQTYEHPVAGPVKVVGPAVRWSETPAAIERPAPLVGEHTREILRGARPWP